MKIFLQWLLVFVLAAILLAYVSGEAADKQTNRLYARAHLSEVQNEGRKDLMAGLMPYAIIGISAIAGTVICVCVLARRPDSAAQPRQVIERRVVIILQPGEYSRREIYKMLSSGDDEGNSNETKRLPILGHYQKSR